MNKNNKWLDADVIEQASLAIQQQQAQPAATKQQPNASGVALAHTPAQAPNQTTAQTPAQATAAAPANKTALAPEKIVKKQIDQLLASFYSFSQKP